jgi:hypothetical protein
LTVRQGANWFRNAEGRVPTNYWRNPDTDQVESINFAQTEAARGSPLWRTGHTQNYNLSLSGGTADLRYHLSGHMDREEGADWDNELRRYGARANVTVAATPTVEVTGTAGYTRGRFLLACEAGCGGVTWASYFSTPAHFGTNDPDRVQLPDGTDRRRGARSFTPEYYWNVTDRTQELGRFTGSVQVNHQPADWFRHRLTFGIDDTREDNQLLTELSDLLLEWSPTALGGTPVTIPLTVTDVVLDSLAGIGVGSPGKVDDEAGTVYCYDTVSEPPVRHRMAYLGYEGGFNAVNAGIDATTSTSAAGAASSSISSLASIQMRTGSVSKPTGRSSSVAGSSFNASMNTSTSAAARPPRIIGRTTRTRF